MPVITNIEDLRVLAQKRVPKMFYDYADSGSWTEGTYRANSSDFQKILLRQRVAVNMEGRTTRTPDLATFSAGVTSQGKTAGEALAANSAEMNKVVAALKKAGIADRDIQTSNLSLVRLQVGRRQVSQQP